MYWPIGIRSHCLRVRRFPTDLLRLSLLRLCYCTSVGLIGPSLVTSRHLRQAARDDDDTPSKPIGESHWPDLTLHCQQILRWGKTSVLCGKLWLRRGGGGAYLGSACCTPGRNTSVSDALDFIPLEHLMPEPDHCVCIRPDRGINPSVGCFSGGVSLMPNTLK